MPARNPLDFARTDGFFEFLGHAFGPYQIRQFGYHDAALTRADLFDGGTRPGLEHSPPGFVGFADPLHPHNHAPAGKVRSGTQPHQFLDTGLRIIQQVNRRRHSFSNIVRGNIRRHPHRDPGSPVDQQVRESRRQYRGLSELVVIVRHEVDRVFIDIRHHQHGTGRQASLGIARRRGAVIQRTEVPVPVHQRYAHGEGLRQPYQRIVNRGVSVRVQFPHNFTHDALGLHVPLIRSQPHNFHLVQNATLHRLHPVFGVGKGPGVNH